jgi:hypothetical protein
MWVTECGMQNDEHKAVCFHSSLRIQQSAIIWEERTMKHGMRSGMVFVFLAVIVSAALLGGCGKSDSGGIGPATASLLTAATPTAGLNTCTTCHTVQTTDWLTSKHANLDPAGNLYSAGVPTVGLVQAGGPGCKSCHDPNGDSNNLMAEYTGNVPRPLIGCESCHGPGSLHADAGGAGPISLLSNTMGTSFGAVTVSGQFVMCTGCHELLNTSTGALNASPTHSTGAPSPTGVQYIITDTHFATAGNWSGAGGQNINDISGYAMNFMSETVCTDCHNPHKNADINKEWANSKHADKLAADAWAHYNWSCDAANCGGTFGDRTSCQRCHTTTGFAKYADALENGDTELAADIFAGNKPQLVYNANFKPEMLECKGCHINNRGNLRNPGAYNASYKIPVGGFPSSSPLNADISYQYPNISISNVCMPCHTGRTSGKALHDLNTGQSAAVNFSNFGFPDGHYLTAGGTMFKGTPYEYVGRNYVDPASYKHNQIGTPNAPNTGSNGPCIGCHMDRTGMSGNHLFEPISTNTGTIIVSSGICFSCHAGSSIDFGTVVQDEKDNFEFALEALEAQLNLVSNYTFTTNYPYFATTNWLSAGDSDTTGNTTGKNNLGAAFNFSLLYHEPGAYVHNSRYVKRILYDSLDWIDDGQMNYSVGATLSATCTSTPQPWCTGAKSYLLPNGVLWQQGPWPNGYGTAAERP